MHVELQLARGRFPCERSSPMHKLLERTLVERFLLD